MVEVRQRWRPVTSEGAALRPWLSGITWMWRGLTGRRCVSDGMDYLDPMVARLAFLALALAFAAITGAAIGSDHDAQDAVRTGVAVLLVQLSLFLVPVAARSTEGNARLASLSIGATCRRDPCSACACRGLIGARSLGTRHREQGCRER